MFRHPSYYKNLRKLARNSELHVRPQGSEACDTDQAISLKAHDGERERATGPGPKQQATSSKQQASSARLLKQQAASIKPRG